MATKEPSRTTVESRQTHTGGCISCATNKFNKTEHHISSDTTVDTSRHYHVRWQKHKTRRRRRNKIATNATTTSLSIWNVLTILMINIIITTTTNAVAVSLPTAAAAATTTATVVAVTFNKTATATAKASTISSSSSSSIGSNALLTLTAAEKLQTPTLITTTSTIGVNRNTNNNNKSTRLRKRHSKRHSDWDDYYNYNESILEWANPCGGNYDPTQEWGGAAFGGGRNGRGHVRRKTPKQVFNNLKKSVGNEFKTLSANQQDIDISNIQIWFLHEYTYKFLPKLKANSSIALKRWHRNFQTYVASFAYLRRVQLKWEHSKTQRESRTARELKELFLSSRSMLCDLENAINNTHPQPPQRLGGRLQQKPNLQIFTREQMNKRLKLRTKRRIERSPPETLLEADSIDLKFVKYYYYEFLETMWKVLRKNMKRRGQIAMRTNRKEFNEVSKNFGSLSRTSDGQARAKKTSWLQEGEQSSRILRRIQRTQRQRSLRKPQNTKHP